MLDKPTNIIIYQTRDYDQFKYIEVNRKITQNSDLERAILTHNKLKYNPIIVTEDKYILDGQHRLGIAKDHDLDIYYVVDRNATFDEVQQLNIGTKVWDRMDHLEFFTKNHYQVYCEITELLNSYHLHLSALLTCFAKDGPKGMTQYQKFKRGLTEFKYPLEDIHNYLQYYEDIYQVYKIYIHKGNPSVAFQICMLSVISHPDYDHDRMMKGIHYYPETFISLHHMKGQDVLRKAILEGIYNKRRASKHHLEL